jgi:type II secretory ATPase GspE/PulE/Tfp pilus assembly ATPase PilB-like protein
MARKAATPPPPPEPQPAAPVPERTNGLPVDFVKSALLAGKYASEEDLAKAEAHAKSHRAPLTEYLYNEQLLNKELLGHAVGEALKEKYVDLAANPPQKEVLTKIPKDIAREHRVILVAESPEVTVATDATDTSALGAVLSPLLPGKTITYAFSFADDIDRALSLYKETLAVRFMEIIKREQKVAPELVEQIIDDAIQLRASDVHIEPQETEVIVRFRIDGVLEDAGSLPKPQYENILNRIKIEARLRIDEHMRSQDGAIRYDKGGVKADLRISILPTVTGEKVVMRLLGAYLKSLTLSELGFSQAHQAKLNEVANRPYGMILTVGPTGSGKTTTLYALLRMLNDSSENVTTIEDPVEYRIAHVNQVQVSEATGLTFGGGLRSIVRQDPDVILVGEIRDLETADLAVNAALTGHLLLSTFHANDSSTVVPRLLDMKVEPFLLASTLSIIVAQRLLRRICNHCKVSETTTVAAVVAQYPKLVPFLQGNELVLYKGKGCQKCNGSGYKGQMGIYEFIEVTPNIQETILRDPSAESIEKAARAEGTRSFFEDGLDKVLAGVTTFEELLRVALPPKLVTQAPK